MITIEKTVDISEDGHIHLDLTLPPPVPSVKTRVVLMFPEAEEKSFSGAVSRLLREELLADAKRKGDERRAEWERTGVDPLLRFSGCCKDVFPEDGLTYQRSMRDEWPD